MAFVRASGSFTVLMAERIAAVTSSYPLNTVTREPFASSSSPIDRARKPFVM